MLLWVRRVSPALASRIMCNVGFGAPRKLAAPRLPVGRAAGRRTGAPRRAAGAPMLPIEAGLVLYGCSAVTTPSAVPRFGPTTARRLVWLAAVALVPVPYWAVDVERAPVARLVLLAVVTGAAAIAEPGGVGSIVAGALVAQCVLWLVVLALAARVVVRLLPAARLGRAVAVLLAALVGLSLLDVYRTPFAQTGSRANLLGIFR